ncbi:MAG: alpha/beta fold hydrolase [Oscillospiraceae bacterium]|nr:alpha/beta fold hydrolase [Oscillospiraceae bacterium]
MRPKQYIRRVKDSDTAILFIHGILGTPEHFEPFIPLVPPDWTIYNILLKGHGGTVKDFSAASMTEWEQQVHRTLQELLASHSRVVVCAHSMGTLFAIREAAENPIAEMFLLNVPLKVRIKPRLIKTSSRVFLGNVKPDDKWSTAAQKAYGIERDMHIIRYLGWIPRYLELFSEIRKTRKLVDRLSVPCRVYLSRKDEMVSLRSGNWFNDNPAVKVKRLDQSGHFYYSPKDLKRLRNDFRKMIRRISDAGENRRNL